METFKNILLTLNEGKKYFFRMFFNDFKKLNIKKLNLNLTKNYNYKIINNQFNY